MRQENATQTCENVGSAAPKAKQISTWFLSDEKHIFGRIYGTSKMKIIQTFSKNMGSRNERLQTSNSTHHEIELEKELAPSTNNPIISSFNALRAVLPQFQRAAIMNRRLELDTGAKRSVLQRKSFQRPNVNAFLWSRLSCHCAHTLKKLISKFAWTIMSSWNCLPSSTLIKKVNKAETSIT